MATKSAAPFLKLKNPYTFGVPVSGEHSFFGREAELRQVFDTLDNVPRGQKQDIVILGPRRIGKSSLLRRLARLLAAPEYDFVPVYLDVQGIQPRLPQILIYSIARGIRQGYEAKGVALDGLPFAALQPDRIPTGMEFMTLNDDLEQLNAAVGRDDLPRLVLMFDEVEVLLGFEQKGILEWLRSLIQALNYAVFVVSGSDQLYSLTQDYGSPFFNIFKTIELFPLDPVAARATIVEPADRIGMAVSPEQVDKILSYSGNNPYFIQGISHFLVEELNRREQVAVLEDDLDRVIISCVRNLAPQFIYYWSVVTPAQQVILYWLAKIGLPLSAAELLLRLPSLEQALPLPQDRKDAFDGLARQQILQEDNGRYWFVVPLFVEWLLANVHDEDITAAAAALQGGDAPEASALRRIMTLTYRQEQLLTLISRDFFPVFNRTTSHAAKADFINALILYADETGQMDKLAAAVRSDFPQQYDAFTAVIPLPEVAPVTPVAPPGLPPVVEPEVVAPVEFRPAPDRAQLLRFLIDRFSLAEMDDLAFQLNIDYYNLPGDTKSARARELVAYLERQDRLNELVEALRRLRPLVADELAGAPRYQGWEVDFAQLRDLLVTHFSEEDLRDVAFRLGADAYVALESASEPGAAAFDLISQMQRRGLLNALLKELEAARPNAPWPWRETAAPREPQIDLSRLGSEMNNLYNLDELRELCFELGVDYEDLPGDTRRTKILQLIVYMQRRARLGDLLAELARQRPEVDWSQFTLPA